MMIYRKAPSKWKMELSLFNPCEKSSFSSFPVRIDNGFI